MRNSACGRYPQAVRCARPPSRPAEQLAGGGHAAPEHEQAGVEHRGDHQKGVA